ncbi:Cysteine protease atg4b [Mortierella alpina]|uniref:Autophagy-related protein 4 n=1 Tax=Mortierella alpina TaxID=64518 RepID=A0A9P6IXM2_MORAP|nr:Cysteine protease atg4b [Mortierella alpina]
MPNAGQKMSATVKGLPTSALATMPKLHHSVEDMSIWKSLYLQQDIHTRQDNQSPLDLATTPAETTGKEIPGTVKMRQVLTKTILNDDSEDPRHRPRLHFERLPIKVQTSAAALSPHGRPFSIVFFFTVESAPATLWYLESAFTQSRTVHERMEPMETFQPNNSDDPASFYIYETHAFNIVQPTHEDTMLDIRVQSPTGTIYAEFSYTFVKDPKRNRTASSASSPTSAPSSPRIQRHASQSSDHTPDTPTSATHWHSEPQSYNNSSPHLQDSNREKRMDSHELDSPSPAVDLSTGRELPNKVALSTEEPSPDARSTPSTATSAPIVSVSGTQSSIPTLVRSHLDDSGDEEDTEELFVESYTEEPDAGEHFMQATSEFFSKMGYWLYNSRVVQYIARDDRSRTKAVFQNDDIWILGVCYSFDDQESSIALPERPRSRKSSTTHLHVADIHVANATHGLQPAPGQGSHAGQELSPGSDHPKPYITSPARSVAESETLSGCSAQMAQRPDSDQTRILSKEEIRERKHKEKELAKAKKLARAKERELEREQARAQEKAKAKEKARLKEREKLQKFKAKISHPQFDEKNLRDGLLDLEAAHTSDTKGNSQTLESDNKASRALHGHDHQGDDSNFGAGLLPDSSEANQSVIRRIRSISLLQKVPGAMDMRSHKKQHQSAGAMDRTHQPRSQSISNTSSVSQKSAGSSSSVSNDGSTKGFAASSSHPETSKGSISVQEALTVGPKPSVLSRISNLNTSQKKLPDLPALDDMPDIPDYRQYEEGSSVSVNDKDHPETPSSPTFPPNQSTDDTPTSVTSSPRSGRRRMTVSGIFSKDSKPESMGNMAALKALVSGTKTSSSKTRQEDEVPSAKQGPLSVGSLGSLSHRISFLPPSSKDAAKGGVTKNVQHWLERRLSSHNLHQHVFVASTDEPVPPVKDMGLSPPGSPLQSTSPRAEPTSPHFSKTRSRKKSSIFSSASSSSTHSSPKSALKSSSPHSPLASSMPTMPDALAWQNQSSNADATGKLNTSQSLPTFQQIDSSVVLVEDSPLTSSASRSSPLEPSPWMPSLDHQNHQQESTTCRKDITLDNSSFRDLVILPPLPPESPSEAYVLLDPPAVQERDPEDSLSISMPVEGADTRVYIPSSELREDIAINQTSALAQNRTTLDQLAAFSEEEKAKDAELSDFRSDWEALWPSKEAEQNASKDTSQFVHVKEVKPGPLSTSLKPEQLSVEERERIRRIGSAYVKVRDPKLDIVAPQPKVPVSLPDVTFGHGALIDIPRTTSPDGSLGPLGNGTAPTKKRRLLQLPSTLLTSLPRPTSPSSPGASLSKSWKSITPRSLSPRHTVPLISSSSTITTTTSSSRPINVQPTHAEPAGTLTEVESKPRSLTAGRSDVGMEATPAGTHLMPVKQSERLKLSPNQTTLMRFMLDFQSRLWFTYRKDMARIEPSYYTSDAGWGCMMRTGQSLLAQAFIQIELGRDWRIRPAPSGESAQRYRALLGWFADEPERYYSIHNIAKSGLALDKRIGEWFGPATVAHSLRRLSQRHVDCPLTIMVPMDNTVYVTEIMNLALSRTGQADGKPLTQEKVASDSWKPVVLLMPARYGLEKITERYFNNLKTLFKLPQFLGIAGGRPGRSLYFVACQGNELFYFDPHFVKPRATQDDLKQCPSASYHCGIVRTMDIVELDPSMMLGFLIRSQDDLADLATRLKQDMEKSYPLLTIQGDIPPSIAKVASTSPAPRETTLQGDASVLPVTLDSSVARSEIQRLGSAALSTERPFQEGALEDDDPPAPRSKKDMKRITKALKSEKQSARTVDSKSSAFYDPYQHRYASHQGDKHDTLSIQSLDSDTSL